MAYEVTFGVPSLRGFSDGSPLRVDNLTLPVGRPMANGSSAALIYSLRAYVAGNGASRSVALQLGASVTPWFTVGASNTGQLTSWVGSSNWLVQGGVAQLQVHMNGSIFFLRGGNGSTFSSYGTSWDGAIAGAYQYLIAPTAPQNAVLTPHPTTGGRLDLTWSPPADFGQASLTGYTIVNSNGLFVANVGPGVNSYTFTGMTPGILHKYYVRARNIVTDTAGTQSVNSNLATAIGPGVPTAPTALTAQPSPTISGQINLSWTAPTNTGPLTGYSIIQNGVQVGTITSANPATTYAVTGLTVGQSYTFTVRARNTYSDANAKVGPDSNAVTANAPGLPTAPRNLVAVGSATNSGQIDLTWDAPSNVANGLTSYGIYYSNGTLIDTVDPSVRTFSILGLTPGTNYSFYVRARNSFAEANGLYSPNSTTATTMAPGLPGAPRTLTATVSTNTFGRITLNWLIPTDTAGGITRYNVYANGTQIGTSTTTSFVADGLTTATTYQFTVAARNAFADAFTPPRVGPLSNAVSAVAPGPPSAPRNLTAAAHPTTAGAINLAWTVPATTSGTITGYTVYRSGGAVVATLNGTATTYTATGLVPAETYSFYVRARNAIADTVGTFGAPSNTATVQALGDPDAPSSLVVAPSTTVAGRLTLTWVAPAGPITGYNIYRTTGQLVAKIGAVTTYVEDFLTPGTSYAYVVRARNAVTDAVNEDGPASAAASGIPSATTTQTIANTAVTNQTNAILNGTYVVTGLSATSLSYVRITAETVPYSTVPIGVGTTVNNTNTNLNGTYTIATPTPTTITYTKAGTAIPANTATFGGVLTNNTNTIFNGTYTLTGVVALDKTITYARTGANVSFRTASGTVTNLTNTTYNGTNKVITAVTEDTLSYALVHSDLSESAATGVVLNNTNDDVFNGTYTVTGAPAHNIFTYVPSVTGTYGALDVDILAPYGEASRVASKSSLEIKYRSGWLG